nr:phosphoribosylanthranilate isomerase [uncultured Aminipila sp.]
MTKIKICGLSRISHIDYVNEAKPDYIGFVFAKSKRQVTYEAAWNLRKSLNKEITAVGVFVNEPLENIAAIVKSHIVGMVQLHGDEEETYIKRLKQIIKVPVIKAVKVEKSLDIEKAEESSADFLLLDSGAGGTGESFDWSLIKKVSKPFFLAGGINVTNVEIGIKMTNPFGIDVSSGVEEEGKKSKQKILEFIRRVRND